MKLRFFFWILNKYLLEHYYMLYYRVTNQYPKGACNHMKRIASVFLIFCVLCGMISNGVAESLEERVSSLEKRVQTLEDLLTKTENLNNNDNLLGELLEVKSFPNAQAPWANGEVFIYCNNIKTLTNKFICFELTIDNQSDSDIELHYISIYLNHLDRKDDNKEIRISDYSWYGSNDMSVSAKTIQKKAFRFYYDNKDVVIHEVSSFGVCYTWSYSKENESFNERAGWYHDVIDFSSLFE